MRQYLVENFGLTSARAELTQFGFAHGWRMAEAMKREFEWEGNEDWRRAGLRIHTLQGLFPIEPGSEDLLPKESSALAASDEAKQHLLHFGRAGRWQRTGITRLVPRLMVQLAAERSAQLRVDR